MVCNPKLQLGDTCARLGTAKTKDVHIKQEAVTNGGGRNLVSREESICPYRRQT